MESLISTSNPADCLLIRMIAEDPGRHARFRGVTFEQFAELAGEAGINDLNFIAQTYEWFRQVVGLPRKRVQEVARQLAASPHAVETLGRSGIEVEYLKPATE